MDKKKKKSIYSKFIVIAIILLNVIFTRTVLKMFSETGAEPSGLIIAWFSFTTVELWSLAGIKKAKERKEHNDY